MTEGTVLFSNCIVERLIFHPSIASVQFFALEYHVPHNACSVFTPTHIWIFDIYFEALFFDIFVFLQHAGIAGLETPVYV